MVLNIDTLAGVVLDFRQDLFSPTAAQTLFTLAAVPYDTQSVSVVVNGVKYELTTHYTVLGAAITWNNVAFTMATTDGVEINYAVAV